MAGKPLRVCKAAIGPENTSVPTILTALLPAIAVTVKKWGGGTFSQQLNAAVGEQGKCFAQEQM